MPIKAFHSILRFLALLGAVHATISPVAECTAKAWVRAPDLTPDTIIRGDARIKISAECPAVETISLGLRLKERSFVKALRSQEDRKLMNSARSSSVNFQRVSPWTPLTSRFPNPSDGIAFQEMLLNEDLWLVREEERIVFETTQMIPMREEPGRDDDVVQDFAILVPSTNFPPALDHLTSAFVMRGDGKEMIDAEFMYEYFVRVPFANGTTKEMTAGITGFQPLYDPADTTSWWPTSEFVGLKSHHIFNPQKGSPMTNYTAQVSGSLFTPGSENQVITVVITRTGPARTFASPLKIRVCVAANFSARWAVEYDMPNSQPPHRAEYMLRSTLEDVEDMRRHPWGSWRHNFRDGTTSVTMPNSTSEEIQASDIVTTTSAAVTIPVEVNRRQITNFETYYQTLANSLSIMLEIPRTDGETVDPDDPSAEVHNNWGPKFTDDEEPWVPWEKKPVSEMSHSGTWSVPYSGAVPVVVRPAGEVVLRCLHPGTDSLGQVVLSDETGCKQRSLDHYLDEGARGPTFVDSGAVHGLLTEDPAERHLRAPILKPVVSSPPEGEELVCRYNHHQYPSESPIYVGETWVRKVANRDQHQVSSAISVEGPSPIAAEPHITAHVLLSKDY